MKPIGRLHVLTDYHFQQRHSHAQLARLVIQGGADMIQFREKYAPVRHALHAADRIAAVCRDEGVPLIVDDRLDVALAVGAQGLHLGQLDLPVSRARRILPAEFVLGASASTLQQALQAQEEGADYIGFGPVFPTHSKDNPASVKGLDTLASVCSVLSIPVIAIAGITAERVRPVLAAGAWGVAVMSAIVVDEDQEAATLRFRREIDQFVAQEPEPLI